MLEAIKQSNTQARVCLDIVKMAIPRVYSNDVIHSDVVTLTDNN